MSCAQVTSEKGVGRPEEHRTNEHRTHMEKNTPSAQTQKKRQEHNNTLTKQEATDREKRGERDVRGSKKKRKQE